jgi:hypothetical protein
MDLQNAELDPQNVNPDAQPSVLEIPRGASAIAVETAFDTQATAESRTSGTSYYSASQVAYGDDGPVAMVEPEPEEQIDAWPDQGITIWPTRTRHSPLLPPLPVMERHSALGWIQEWPAAWLRETPIRRISLRPRTTRPLT